MATDSSTIATVGVTPALVGTPLEVEPVAARCATKSDPIHGRPYQRHAVRSDETEELVLRSLAVRCVPSRAGLVEDLDYRVGQAGLGQASQRRCWRGAALTRCAEDVDEQVTELSKGVQVALVEGPGEVKTVPRKPGSHDIEPGLEVGGVVEELGLAVVGPAARVRCVQGQRLSEPCPGRHHPTVTVI